MSADDTSHEILTSALGLLTATHADSRMAGPVTMDYLTGVPTDRSQMLDLVAGMTAMAAMLIKMRAEETGVRPEAGLAELGRRIQQLFSGQELGKCNVQLPLTLYLGSACLSTFNRLSCAGRPGGGLNVRHLGTGQRPKCGGAGLSQLRGVGRLKSIGSCTWVGAVATEVRRRNPAFGCHHLCQHEGYPQNRNNPDEQGLRVRPKGFEPPTF